MNIPRNFCTELFSSSEKLSSPLSFYFSFSFECTFSKWATTTEIVQLHPIPLGNNYYNCNAKTISDSGRIHQSLTNTQIFNNRSDSFTITMPLRSGRPPHFQKCEFEPTIPTPFLRLRIELVIATWVAVRVYLFPYLYDQLCYSAYLEITVFQHRRKKHHASRNQHHGFYASNDDDVRATLFI